MRPRTADADGDGTNNFQEFLNHTDPNKIQFSLSFTNLYVTNTAVPAQLSIIGGVPFYIEVLVNSTNISSTNWQAYTGTNLNVNLGTTDGFYEVRVGLKGLPVDAQQTWEWGRLKLDRTPPQLVITGPTNTTVTVPLLQLTGYSSEALSSLTYAISNAAGIATGLQAVITGQVLQHEHRGVHHQLFPMLRRAVDERLERHYASGSGPGRQHGNAHHQYRLLTYHQPAGGGLDLAAEWNADQWREHHHQRPSERSHSHRRSRGGG